MAGSGGGGGGDTASLTTEVCTQGAKGPGEAPKTGLPRQMCLPVRDQNVTVIPGRRAVCLARRSLGLRGPLGEPLCLGCARAGQGRAGQMGGEGGSFFSLEGGRSEARKWLAGFFPLPSRGRGDVGGLRPRQGRLLTRMGGGGLAAEMSCLEGPMVLCEGGTGQDRREKRLESVASSWARLAYAGRRSQRRLSLLVQRCRGRG